MQMDTRMTTHIVFLTRISEEIWLGTCFHTGIKERQTMLRHHGIVVIARDDLEFAF